MHFAFCKYAFCSNCSESGGRLKKVVLEKACKYEAGATSSLLC